MLDDERVAAMVAVKEVSKVVSLADRKVREMVEPRAHESVACSVEKRVYARAERLVA